jgi:hypothetical protein
MTSCSFSHSIGGRHIQCGANIKISQNVVVPLLSCNRAISTHLQNCHIDARTVDSEAKLLQLRGGLHTSITTLTICPNHRQKLGIGWSCGKYCSVAYCSGNKSMPRGTISKDQAIYLLSCENRHVGIGSGMIKTRLYVIRDRQFNLKGGGLIFFSDIYFLNVTCKLFFYCTFGWTIIFFFLQI